MFDTEIEPNDNSAPPFSLWPRFRSMLAFCCQFGMTLSIPKWTNTESTVPTSLCISTLSSEKEKAKCFKKMTRYHMQSVHYVVLNLWCGYAWFILLQLSTIELLADRWRPLWHEPGVHGYALDWGSRYLFLVWTSWFQIGVSCHFPALNFWDVPSARPLVSCLGGALRHRGRS